ncbi:hypothetical protein R3P38DRAFT_3612130 [Favolaschia claudopus]|uniref:MACPF domain-containing protein n=1 Tax=Favolaschia claudopus TaxID=2862362 RepID=A0AAW0A5J8_9AGAR
MSTQIFSNQYDDVATETGRHAGQAVVLLVGHSGHGKSTTINRLVGTDLLEVAEDGSGSTTKSLGIRLSKMPINASGYFTSAAGKTMQALSSSGLVDPSRPNVVVVVTKSISSWTDLVDDAEESRLDPRVRWMLEAKIRKDIIVGLQRKIFRAIFAAWDVVFVENGRTRNAAYPRLPNGELSHQNLFDAISRLIRRPGVHGRADLAVEETRAHIQTRVLVTKDDVVSYTRDQNNRQHDDWLSTDTLPPPNRAGPLASNLKEQQIAEEFLASRTIPYRALSGDLFTGGRDRQQESFVKESVDENTILSPLTPIGTAQRVTGCPQEMLGIISDLGRWTGGPASREKYYDFFSNHGTHVVLRLALGGKLRIARWDDTKNAGRRKKREFGAGMNIPRFPFGGNMNHEKSKGEDEARGDMHVEIFREGGAEVAQDLTSELETHAKSSTSVDSSADKLEWPNVEIRKKWILALKAEPTFCPDAEETEYREIFSLGGLTSVQRDSLRDASNSYLMTRHIQQHGCPGGARGGQKDDMNRQRNHRGVMNWFHKFFTGGKGHKV